MLTDPKEIEIISTAKQKNVRDPKRSRAHFENIFEDFLKDAPFEGNLLDLGPGQYDFCELARLRGGVCTGVDFDSPVIELGKYKGFDVVEMNIQKLVSYKFEKKFIGVFNKFALNAFWFHEDEALHREFIFSLCKLIEPTGWAWIAPWNGVPKKVDFSPSQIEDVLNTQKETFMENGFTIHNLKKEEAIYYGINGNVANNVIITKNLIWNV